jgi:hypothetical protein
MVEPEHPPTTHDEAGPEDPGTVNDDWQGWSDEVLDDLDL